MEGNRRKEQPQGQSQPHRRVPQSPPHQQRMHINEIALSQNNINELASVCERFVRDKYSVNLTTETLRIILPRIVSNILNQFQHSVSPPVVHEINKIAMMRIKEFVLEQKVSRLQQQQEEDEQQQIRMKQHIQMHMQQPDMDVVQDEVVPFQDNTVLNNGNGNNMGNGNNVDIAGNNYDGDDEVAEQTFMEKLKQLEIQRTQGMPLSQSSTVGVENPIPSPQQNIQQNTFVSGKAMQNQPTIIYVPSQPTTTSTSWKSKVTVINGVDRQWDYFHERSSTMWPGPLPSVSTVKLSCLLLPTFISSITPIVFMKIVGAGQNSEEVAFVLKKPSSASASTYGGWDTWTPLTHTIQALACPWTINLYNYKRNPLNMGCDAQSIKVATLLVDGNTKVQFDSKLDRIKKGDIIKLKNASHTDSEIECTVVNVVDEFVVLSGNHSQHVGYIICNTHLQLHMIVEVLT
jgi:hypothetical protein